MTSREIYCCMYCNKKFEARTTDRARGWARFCTKRCKAVYQYRSAIYGRQDDFDDVDWSHGGWDEHKEWI